jgi:hypothetical protein
MEKSITVFGGIHLETVFHFLKEGKGKVFGDEDEIEVWTIADQERVSCADWYVGKVSGSFRKWLAKLF